MTPEVKIRIQSLDFSEPQNRNRCPIANALKLSDPDIQHPRVEARYIWLSRLSTDKRYKYTTPRKAVEFIRKIDTNGNTTISPFTLSLSDQNLVWVKPRRRDPEGSIKAWAAKRSKPANSKVSRPSAIRRGRFTKDEES
jgi:hypothetical protein